MSEQKTTISFRKLSGAGNTFVMIEEDALPSDCDRAGLARTLCTPDGPAGGADGMIVVGGGDRDESFGMDYYNNDGSTGMMCGNGGRCAVRFAVDRGYVKGRGELTFTNAGVEYQGRLVDQDIEISFPDPIAIRAGIETDVEGLPTVLHFVDVGTPHILLFVSDAPPDIAGSLQSLEIDRWGPPLRHHPAAGPGGANANFLDLLPEGDGLRLRTFERGVEGETGACGTGAIASGLIGAIIHELPSPIQIIPTSGDRLFVGYRPTDEGFTDITLRGPAVMVMEGRASL